MNKSCNSTIFSSIFSLIPLILITQASAKEKSLVKSGFSCGTSKGLLTTFFFNGIKKIPLISWSSQFSKTDSWSPEERCKQISKKFSQNQTAKTLEYIIFGRCNEQTVLCASEKVETPKWTSDPNGSHDSTDLLNNFLASSKLSEIADVTTLLAKHNLSDLFKEKMMESQLIFKLSALEEDILTVLRSQNMYGLQIIKQLEKAHEGQRKIKEGSIYPTLHRMEKKEYIDSYWGEDRPEERGGARRKYYKITEAGIQVLNSRFAVRQRLSSLELQLCPV
jgi:PadR family transcriptional regulator PadR